MAGRHRSPDEKPDPRAREVPHRRPGPKHSGPEAPKKKAAPKKAPVSAAPASPAAPVSAPRAPRAPSGPRPRPRAAGLRAAAEEGREYARRQAFKATTGRPSVTGRAASGAAAGAASGAAIGSAVPGIGTAVGAGTGAVVGAAGGGIAGARAKKQYRAAMRASPGARRLIVAEFAVCAVVAALSPLTAGKRDEPPGAWMKRMTAIMGLFFILGLVSAGGRTAAKAAAGLGGLVTVALLISERDLFATVAARFSAPNALQRGTGPGSDETLGDNPPGEAPSGPSPAPPRTTPRGGA